MRVRAGTLEGRRTHVVVGGHRITGNDIALGVVEADDETGELTFEVRSRDIAAMRPADGWPRIVLTAEVGVKFLDAANA